MRGLIVSRYRSPANSGSRSGRRSRHPGKHRPRKGHTTGRFEPLEPRLMLAGDVDSSGTLGDGVLLGISRDGELYEVDLTTGAGSPLGTLTTSTEIECGAVGCFSQLPDGEFEMVQFDPETGALLSGPVANSFSHNGLEFVDGTLYSTSIPGSGASSSLNILDPFTGSVTLIGPTGLGPISGLAYDPTLEIMFGIEGGPGPAQLVWIDLSTGSATPIGDTDLQAGSLEFGPDGNLYAGGTGTNADQIWLIDPASGAASLLGNVGVGNAGVGPVTGLTLLVDEAHFVEHDHFDDTEAVLDLIQPDGAAETIMLRGSTSIDVWFERDEGEALDDTDGTGAPNADGLDEVMTEMVALDLMGNSSMGPLRAYLNPALKSTGIIQEHQNDLPGVLELPPFAPGSAWSWFDLFVQIEVETPLGRVLLHNEEPKQLQADITNKPPGPGDTYESPSTVELYDEQGNSSGFFLGPTRHTPRPMHEGDMDFDGNVDFDDIDDFVHGLTHPEWYEVEYGVLPWVHGDMDMDGDHDFDDIRHFASILIGALHVSPDPALRPWDPASSEEFGWLPDEAIDRNEEGDFEFDALVNMTASFSSKLFFPAHLMPPATRTTEAASHSSGSSGPDKQHRDIVLDGTEDWLFLVRGFSQPQTYGPLGFVGNRR